MKANQYVQSISFPRSGHHYLERLLSRVFSDGFIYCSYYGHCHGTECDIKDVNFVKNHDFSLSWPVTDYPHIVQYRHPVEAWASTLFQQIAVSLSLKNGDEHCLNLNEETAENFGRKALDSELPYGGIRFINYWKGFVERWVFAPLTTQVLLVSYSDLISKPHKTLDSVVPLFTTCRPTAACKRKISKAVQAESPKKNNVIEELLASGLATEDELRALELMCSDYLRYPDLGLVKRF